MQKKLLIYDVVSCKSNCPKVWYQSSGFREKIEIVFDESLSPGNPGKTRRENPNVIVLGPSAFFSETELANTARHCRKPEKHLIHCVFGVFLYIFIPTLYRLVCLIYVPDW